MIFVLKLIICRQVKHFFLIRVVKRNKTDHDMDFKHQNFVTFGALRERLFYFLPLCISEMLLGMPSCCPSNTGIKLL